MQQESVVSLYSKDLISNEVKVALSTALDTAHCLHLHDQIIVLKSIIDIVFPDSLEALFFAARAGLANTISRILDERGPRLRGAPAHPVKVLDDPKALSASSVNPNMKINNSAEAWQIRVGPFRGKAEMVCILDEAILSGSAP